MSISDLLKKKIQDEFKAGLPFMEGKEKGSIVTGEKLTVVNFGFLVDNDSNEDYAVFTVKEDDEHFYFGGNVITEKFKTIQTLLSDDEIEEIKKEGLEVVFNRKTSKDKKREYMDMEVI